MLLWVLTACRPTGVELGTTLPDFSLVDENPTSATYQQAVSPLDFRGMASAWYFGHAS